MSIGSLDATQITGREVFKPAILANAAAVVLGHKHPSGDPTPSPSDVAVTRTMVNAGKLLNVDVVDHIIIGDRQHLSLKERGSM